MEAKFIVDVIGNGTETNPFRPKIPETVELFEHIETIGNKMKIRVICTEEEYQWIIDNGGEVWE